MIFNNFDIDADCIDVDGQKIVRPSYISPSVWYDFWSFAPEANNSGSIQSIIDTEVDALIRSNEMEHEEELEKQSRELFDTLNEKIENLLQETRNKFYEIEDLIEQVRPVKDE